MQSSEKVIIFHANCMEKGIMNAIYIAHGIEFVWMDIAVLLAATIKNNENI